MAKRQTILEKYGSCIWYSEKEDTWYCHLPDSSKKEGRRKIKRKQKSAIQDVVYEYYFPLENEKEQKNLQSTKDEQFAEKIHNMSVKDLFEEFIIYKKNLVGSGTIKRMVADWTKFYLPEEDFIELPFMEVKKINVDEFFNLILEKYTLKDKAFLNMRGILKQMYEYAIDADYLKESPYRIKVNQKKIIKTRKQHESKEVYLNHEIKPFIEEMERRVRENPKITTPLAVELNFELGLRQGEIIALKKSDIVGNKLHIRRQLIKEFDNSNLNQIKFNQFVIVEYTKSECGNRWIPLSDKALDIIERVSELNQKNNEHFEDYLFVRHNNVITPAMIDTQIVRGCNHIGIPVRRMHKIRKTYASTLYENGVPITVISKLLGHADESTTIKHYIYNLDNDTETDSKVLNALRQGYGNNTILPKEKVTRSDQNIIQFFSYKKQEEALISRTSSY